MRIRIKVGTRSDEAGWNAVKLFGLIVVVGALVSSSSRGVVKSSSSSKGLATVVPAAIRAGQVDSVTVPFTARVKQVVVAPGAAVAAGQLLAVLESDDVRRQLENAEHRVALAQRRAGGNPVKSSRADQLQLRTARRGLDLARKRLSEDSFAEAEAAYAAAKLRTSKIRELAAQRMATSSELEAAAREEQNEARNLSAAREHYSRLEQEVETYETQVAVIESQSALMDNSADRSFAQMELTEAASALESARQNLERLEVKAPRGGVILNSVPGVGDTVFAGSPFLFVADVSRLSFEAPVSALIARQIKPGSPVRLRVPTEPPRQVDAEVSTVALAPDPIQQSYVIKAVIANPDRNVILVGMEGAMEFPHSDTLWRRLFY